MAVDHGHDHGHGHGHDHGHGPIRGQQVGVVEGVAHPPLQQVGVGVGVPQQVEVVLPVLEVGVGVPQQVEVGLGVLPVPEVGVGVPQQVEVGVTLPSANRIATYDGKIKHQS